MPMALTPYGGRHQEDKDLAESWTRKTTHTGMVSEYDSDFGREVPNHENGAYTSARAQSHKITRRGSYVDIMVA